MSAIEAGHLLFGGIEPRKGFTFRLGNRLRVNDGSLSRRPETVLRYRKSVQDWLAAGLHVGEGRSARLNQVQCRVDGPVVLQIWDRLNFEDFYRASQAAFDPITLRQKVRSSTYQSCVRKLHVHRDARACCGSDSKCSLFPFALTVTPTDPGLEKCRGNRSKDGGDSSNRLDPHSEAGICDGCENARGTVHSDGAGRKEPDTAARGQQIIASRHNVDTAQLAPRCQSSGRMQKQCPPLS